MTELLISVLENYDTDRWILKDSVSCLQLFGEVDCSLADSTVAFHPDHNEKFAKMGPQTLVFAVLPLAPHFIGTDGPTVSFTGSGKFTSGQCLQS